MPLNLSRQKYQTLNTIHVSKDALQSNFHQISQLQPNASICPVLKSNGYGHGLTTVAPIFDALKPAFLIVDSLYEAYELKKIGVKSNILIMGYTNPENFKHKKLPFHFSVFDLQTAEILNRYQPGVKIHVFLDTGMHREGVPLSAFKTFIRKLKALKNLRIEGYFSHFADADNPNTTATAHEQLNVFKQGLGILHAENIFPTWRHIGASAGCLKIQDESLNMFRVGLASYGIMPLEKNDVHPVNIALQPALSFISQIVQIKKIKKGEKVGYNYTFTATKDMTLGLIPAGYYEGVDRRLSNKGFVQVKGKMCPIVGRVSMNMTVIDVSMVPRLKIGQKCVIYSSNRSNENSIENSALTAGTIPYELLVHLAESVRREII